MKQIKTKEELFDAMLNVAKVTAEIQKAEAESQKKIDDIIAKRTAIVSPFQTKEAELVALIETYVTDNRATLFTGDSKTLKTPYGTISFKWTNEKMVIDTTEEEVIGKIRHSIRYLFDKNYRSAVSTKYVLVKEVLKQISDADLLKLGVHKSSEEKIYIKPDLKALVKPSAV